MRRYPLCIDVFDAPSLAPWALLWRCTMRTTSSSSDCSKHAQIKLSLTFPCALDGDYSLEVMARFVNLRGFDHSLLEWHNVTTDRSFCSRHLLTLGAHSTEESDSNVVETSESSCHHCLSASLHLRIPPTGR